MRCEPTLHEPQYITKRPLAVIRTDIAEASLKLDCVLEELQIRTQSQAIEDRFVDVRRELRELHVELAGHPMAS